jgi:uncharacterized protein
MPTTTVEAPRKIMRGFATLSAERKREIASKGGHAANAKGVCHKWNSEEAAAAGRIGGKARTKRKPRGEEK